MKMLSAGAVVCVLMASCGGDNAEPSAAPSTVVVTETVVASDTPATPQGEPEPAKTRESYPYKGYPKVVAKADVPSQMHLYVNGPKAVGVAPGVFTEWIQGVNLRAAAKEGALFGYCAAVKQAKKKLHNRVGFTCW